MPEPSLSATSGLFSQKGANCSFRIRSYKNRIILHNICKIENFLPVPFLCFSPPGISIPTAPSRQRSQVPEESLWHAGQFYYCGLCGTGFLESSLLCFPRPRVASCSQDCRFLSWEKPQRLFLWIWRSLSWDFGDIFSVQLFVLVNRHQHTPAANFFPMVIFLGPAEGAQ